MTELEDVLDSKQHPGASQVSLSASPTTDLLTVCTNLHSPAKHPLLIQQSSEAVSC